MTDFYIRDAIGRFSQHHRSAPEVSLRGETAADLRLADAILDWHLYGGEERWNGLTEAATIKFVELASEKFGEVTSITYWGPNSDGLYEPESFATRGFQRYTFDPRDPEYPAERAPVIAELEDLARLINTDAVQVDVRLPEGASFIDRSIQSWPREVTQEHLDADRDHNPVDDGADTCATCGLAITSDAIRHGFDA